jgi:hypothetical protein
VPPRESALGADVAFHNRGSPMSGTRFMSQFENVKEQELASVDGGWFPIIFPKRFVETMAALGEEVFKPIDFESLRKHYQK